MNRNCMYRLEALCLRSQDKGYAKSPQSRPNHITIRRNMSKGIMDDPGIQRISKGESPTPPSIDSTHFYDILTSYGLCVLKNGTVNDDGEAADNLLTLFESIMLEIIGSDEPDNNASNAAVRNGYRNELRVTQRTKAAAALERLRNG